MSGQSSPGATDPSMDDILASIRKILNEDETTPAQPAPPAAEAIQLTTEMMIAPPEKLAATEPRVLACMHGSAWRGDGGRLLRALGESLAG